MGKRLRVAVILGGTSSEREVSLKSGRAVIEALDRSHYHVAAYDPAEDISRLVADAPQLDVALIMIHGRGGEDGTVQGLLDLLGVPYQSAGVLGCALAMDKHLSKERYRQHGLPVAPDVLLIKGDPDAAARVMARPGLPVVIKPAHEGSSCGISIVQRAADLEPALRSAFALDVEVLAEAFLAGREVTCGVLGHRYPEALPLVEILPGDKYSFFDFEAKYTPGATREVCPAQVDSETTRLVQELAVRAHQALTLQGYSRSDFILTSDGPVILETNTIPGMTHTSLLPQAAAAAGMDFPALCSRLVELALSK